MAVKKKFPRISAGDMEILSMLWDHGPLTLPEAHQRFGQYGRPVAYTTIQTRLNRLFEKGAIRRSPEPRPLRGDCEARGSQRPANRHAAEQSHSRQDRSPGQPSHFWFCSFSYRNCGTQGPYRGGRTVAPQTGG